MAGSSFNGLLNLVLFSVSARFTGTTSGIGSSLVQWGNGNGYAPGLGDIATFWISSGGTRTTFDSPGDPSVDVAILGQIQYSDACNYGQDWYEKIHVLPRPKIDFGDIITLVEDTYLLHSAFRKTIVTLSSVTNNASPGVDFPNLTTPLTVYPMETVVDDTLSQSNGAGTGLGTIVQLKIQAPLDGLPFFDTSVVFQFTAPANDVRILVKGRRIVLIPMRYEAPLKETLAWRTDVIEALAGKEQRIALRKSPRQLFDVNYKLDGNDRQRMHALLFDWMDGIFGFPLWHERVFLTAPASAGVLSYSVANADQVDFRIGGYAVLITDNFTYDVVSISAVTANTITAGNVNLNSYPAGTEIMPLRTARIRDTVSGRKYLNNLEEFRLQFETSDNSTGAQEDSSSPGFWSTYNSRVLFSDPNMVSDDTMGHEHRRRISRIDNETGVVEYISPYDRSKTSFEKGFFLRSRADILLFRKLLGALRGRQKSFYLPTFSDDLEVVGNLSVGTNTVTIRNIDYTRFVRSRLPMSLFRITFTDGTSLVRSVTSSAVTSSTVETLTLNTTWPANRTAAEVQRVEFYELVRFDTDEVILTHERIGAVKCTVPVTRVFDDN